VGTGLLYALEHRGFDVRVPRDLEVSFGEHRVDDGRPRRAIVIVPYRGTVTPPDIEAELVATYEPPVDLARRRARAEDDLVEAIERRGGVDVAGLGTIAPADARAWVEGGGFLSAQAFALIDPSVVEHPAGRALVDLSVEPLSSFAVFVLPAP
jgi:hypothetical protein